MSKGSKQSWASLNNFQQKAAMTSSYAGKLGIEMHCAFEKTFTY